LQKIFQDEWDLGTEGSLLGLWLRSVDGYEWHDDLELFRGDPEDGEGRLPVGTWALRRVEARARLRTGGTLEERKAWLDAHPSTVRYALQGKMPAILAALDDLVPLIDDEEPFRAGALEFAAKFGQLGLRWVRFGDHEPDVSPQDVELLQEWQAEVRHYGAMRSVLGAIDRLAAGQGHELHRRQLREALEAAEPLLHSLRYGSPRAASDRQDLEWAREYVASIVDQRVSGHMRSATRPAPDGALRFMPDSLLTAIYLELGLELAGGRKFRRCKVCRQPFQLTRRDKVFCSANCQLKHYRARQRSGGNQ
jgi:hypothetical protein